MKKAWIGLTVAIACAWILVAWFSTAQPASASAPANAWGGCWYLVQRGDTLFSIGLRYGVSPYYLAQSNGLWNPNYIYAGMKLRVPCDGKQPYPPKPPRPEKTTTPCEPAAQYVVKPGDNLFRIALNHGTTVNAIRDANNLWGKVLRPGMVLTIPCPTNQNHVQPPAAPQNPTTAAPAPEKSPTLAPPTDQAPQQPLPPPPSAQISVGAQAIEPNSATIQVGQSVVWINASQNIYTIISGLPGQPNDVFNSGEMPPGATFIFTFTSAGSYSYYVNENPTLIGQVVVNP